MLVKSFVIKNRYNEKELRQARVVKNAGALPTGCTVVGKTDEYNIWADAAKIAEATAFWAIRR